MFCLSILLISYLGSWLLLVRSLLSGQSANQLRYRPKQPFRHWLSLSHFNTETNNFFKCFADHQILTEFKKKKKRLQYRKSNIFIDAMNSAQKSHHRRFLIASVRVNQSFCLLAMALLSLQGLHVYTSLDWPQGLFGLIL
jgi:hypothetical protein